LKPELRRVGNSQTPIVVIDEFSGDSESIAKVAEALAPFPEAPLTNYYPGLRRVIGEADEAADAYVDRTCQQAAQFIAGAFDIESYSLAEASFSMVTNDPARLAEAQRAPHFDSTNQKYLALLHYLRVPEGSGTAFYRQRSTGIERVTDGNVSTFVETAKAEARLLPSDSGYIHGSNQFFEQIGAVEGVADRLIIYQGSLLHSGIIPRDMNFSPDPRLGRLTANFFLRGH
jgi:hypothetical protein